jgi:hypothetical protein
LHEFRPETRAGIAPDAARAATILYLNNQRHGVAKMTAKPRAFPRPRNALKISISPLEHRTCTVECGFRPQLGRFLHLSPLEDGRYTVNTVNGTVQFA